MNCNCINSVCTFITKWKTMIKNSITDFDNESLFMKANDFFNKYYKSIVRFYFTKEYSKYLERNTFTIVFECRIS